MPLPSEFYNLVLDPHTVPPELLNHLTGAFNNVNVASDEKKINEEKAYIACCKGRTGSVRKLIARGVSVNLVNNDSDRETLLHQASTRGYIKIVKFLIENGADINLVNSGGATPLDCASFKGHLEIIELFINNKATTSVTKERLLCISCVKGNIEIVKLLIKPEANVNIDNYSCGTPLDCAYSGGHTEIVKLLVENGANIKLANKGGALLNWAYFKGHNEIVELLIKNEAITSKNKKDLLHQSCEEGNIEIVKLLMNYKIDVDLVNSEGKTLLYQASRKGYIDIVKLLIEKGANVNLANDNGEIPLYCAYIKGHNQIVELFINNEAITRSSKEKLLFYSCLQGRIETVKLLIENGVNVNADNDGDGTALELACSAGYIDIANLLIENGANINNVSNYGATPLGLAISEHHDEIIKLLIDKKADVNRVSASGKTPLHYASKKGNSKIVGQLIKHGAEIDVISNSGRTPLCYARSRRYPEIVERLIYALQNVTESKPRSIQQDEGLSAIWNKLQKLEKIKKCNSRVKFSSHDLISGDIEHLASAMTKKDLNFLIKQDLPDNTAYMQARLKKISSAKEERDKIMGSIIDFLAENPNCRDNLFFSEVSTQSGSQSVRLHGYAVREILEYLDTGELKILGEVVGNNEVVNNNPLSFFSKPVEYSIKNDDSKPKNHYVGMS